MAPRSHRTAKSREKEEKVVKPPRIPVATKRRTSFGTLKRLPKECYSSLITGASHDYARLWLSGRVKSDIKTYRDIFAEAAWNSVKG